MKTLFLFGAGASTFSGFCPSFPGHKNLRDDKGNLLKPPLGSELFNCLRNTKTGREISKDIVSLFEVDFEKGMERLWSEQQGLATPFLRETALYLLNFSLNDQQNENSRNGICTDNYYSELLDQIVTSNASVVLSTINYDLLIEDAIENAGKEVSYCLTEDTQYVPLLKIHGSCNFLPNMGDSMIGNFSFEVTGNQQIIGTGEDCLIRVSEFIAVTRDEARFFNTYSDSLAPAMAMYLPSKAVVHGREIVTKQQREWVDFVKNIAERIIIIGVRPPYLQNNKWSDPHIWNVLAESKAEIHYVGKEANDFEQWAEHNNNCNSQVMAQTFKAAMPKLRKLFKPKFYLKKDEITPYYARDIKKLYKLS